MKTKAYDFRSFCRGELVRTDKSKWNIDVPVFATVRALLAFSQYTSVEAVAAMAPMGDAVTVTTMGPDITIDHAFDPVITMLQQMAFPVATICIAWACLEAMIGKPASAVSRAKWAALGYIAMRYAPDLLRHI